MSLEQAAVKSYIQVHNNDNVAVALKDLAKGTTINVNNVNLQLNEDIGRGHKIALSTLSQGQEIIKYGYSIGYTTCDTKAGDWIHSHNLKTLLSDDSNYLYQPSTHQQKIVTNDMPTFMGYPRNNGLVGIRNELWIINSVGCVNHLAQSLVRQSKALYGDRIDDFLAVTHPFGCSQLGDDLAQTKNLLASLATNPNAGAVLFLGLGCENNQLSALIEELPTSISDRISYFNAQQVDDEEEEGMRHIEKLLAKMDSDERVSCPVSKLTVGMKCGGSDGLSGLTANPLLGRISEKMANYGATVILTETPEMFGAEQVLMNNAANEQVYGDIVKLVDGFKQYFIDNNQPVYENPSPGNKDGGLTTLEDKSLGAIQKGGNAPVQAVINYGEKALAKNGITLLQGPGNDAVSSTALAASGANMVLFTTGRGTPLGVPVPTVKIASNSNLATRKKHWIDYDAGQLLRLDKTQDECTEEFFQLLLEIASGKATKNELNQFKEISIWKGGVTL
ncbi:altronate dehydratase family protein [Thalassotalea fonticola]|uniref:Altronate dehydratase family protein n=1 Tax=Thalassotalea fonticola TaxID=3065649 RepID=A0ABZ0GUX4_9GAMM|nr:altronate dehydratase family protein [Colwelliaceae bacterium S1-1]